MAQATDYVLGNVSAPSFRSELNSILSAIVSLNSGDNQPGTRYANMLWYETDTNQIKKRNEGVDTWTVLGTVNETEGKFEPNQSFASFSEATGFTDNTHAMTSLRTFQSIVAATNVARTVVTAATFSTSATTFTPITGLTETITPQLNTSLVKVTVVINFGRNSNQPSYFRLTRDGVEISAALGAASGSRERVTVEGHISSQSTSTMMNSALITFVDAPATTSAVTYGVEVRGQNRTASPGTFYLNRSGTDTDSAAYSRSISTIILEEILR